MTTPTFETILYAVKDGVATVTLNRPDRLNAFTNQMMLDMIAALDAADADDAVRCVIVTGAGRGFCAGADLSAGGATFDYDSRGHADGAEVRVSGVHRDGGGRLTLRLFDNLKPVIAAVNGPAVGVGATMQLAMDFRLASTDARYGFVFARRGITPEACSSWFLPRLVGLQTALEWCYTGRVFPAAEAHEKDWFGPFMNRATYCRRRALAQDIAANAAPVSVALTRQMLWRMAGADHPMQAHRADSRAIQARGAAADAKEGVTSFLEKRPAIFPDRVSSDIPNIWPHWNAPEFS